MNKDSQNEDLLIVRAQKITERLSFVITSLQQIKTRQHTN